MPDLSSSLRELIEGAAPPIDVDAIVRARRRRRMRRRSGIGAAVVVVAALITVTVFARPAHEPEVVSVGGQRRAAEADATRAALSQLTIISPGGGSSALTGAPGSIAVTDAASGRSHTVAFPVGGARSITYPFLALGSNVVFVVDAQTGPYDPAIGTAYVASANFEQWRAIAPASYAFAARDPGRLWLVSDNATPDQRLHGTEYGAIRSVTEVGVDGSSPSRAYPLTGLRSPVAAVDGGLLTSRANSALAYEVWDPATGRVVRRLGIDGYTPVASGRFAAWTAANCPPLGGCVLHLTDLRTGTDRTVAPPRGLRWSEQGAFSPDGARLALVAAPPPTRAEIERTGFAVPPGTRKATVVVVDPETGGERTWSTTVWKGGLSPTWAPDGSLLFFTRDRGHVGYVNPSFVDSPVRELSIANADGFLVADRPTPSTARQRYEYDGQVAQTRHHSAELCIYATTLDLGPSSDSCAGPQVVGWDPNRPNGRYHVVGTYDGHVFTLTEPPSAARKPSGSASPPRAKLASGCAAPPGGWRVTDPSKLTFDTYTAVTNAAQDAPDFAGIWAGPYLTTPGVVDANLAVINFAFTGSIAEHRRALAAIYGGPICVVQHPRPYAELQRISHDLLGPTGKALGLQLIAIGPDDVRDVVHAEAVAVSPAMRRAIDQRYGRGAVEIVSILRPLA